MRFSHFSAAVAALLPLSVVAVPTDDYSKRSCPSDATSYCPCVCSPDEDTRESLFKAFNDQLWSGDATGGNYILVEI
jgi:hypothetical protein